MADTWAIETDGLTKRYRFGRVIQKVTEDRSRVMTDVGPLEAVSRLNLRVGVNRITGFLGRNGAGKTTTLKMLLGISRPSSGSGKVLGYPIDDRRQSREMRRHVAYVAEDKETYGYYRVAEMIDFTKSFYRDWRSDVEVRLITQFDLPLRFKVSQLSKGMRTKLALLLALARRPDLLILDEPSEGLDPVAIEQLLQALVTAAADGTTIFFSSHQIADVERIADHVCIIDRGKLVLDASLDDIRQGYRRVTFGFSTDPPGVDFAGEGVASVRTEGRQMTVVASRHAEAVVERAHALGAVSVDTSPVSLRELFLETVTEDAR